jgi:hypothetical protein
MAIKIVPVTGTDIQSSIKEMEILGKCNSTFIVRYFGAYYKKDHLWQVSFQNRGKNNIKVK